LVEKLTSMGSFGPLGRMGFWSGAEAEKVLARKEALAELTKRGGSVLDIREYCTSV
jgi:hypothetical protein